MGGGGNWYWPSDKNINDLLNEAMDKEKQSEFKRSVNEYLQSLLTNINDRDSEQINTYLDEIKKVIEKDIEGFVDLKFGGSVSKHTYANGLSDIDILVEVNNSELSTASPHEILDYFARKIESKLPHSSQKIGKLALTVTFPDGHEIQLLPCLKTETGIKIPTIKEDAWSNVIKPKSFATKLTEINRSCSGRVIPTIKLFKVLNDNLPEDLRLSGYHIESLAINAFKNYSNDLTYQGMLQHFCKCTKDAVLNPIKDKTGQSIHVDDYLGESNSIARKQVSKALERLSNRLQKADAQLAFDQWQDMFDMD